MNELLTQSGAYSWSVADSKLRRDAQRTLATNSGAFRLNKGQGAADASADVAVPPASDFSYNGCPIPVGHTVIMGTAGTGKSVLISHLCEQATLRKVAYNFFAVNEPDYEQAALPGPEADAAIAQAILSAKPGELVLIDSLRHLATVGTGYPAKLGSSGFDISMFQTASDLDRIAKTLRIRLVTVLYLNTFQLSRGDSNNLQQISVLVETIAGDMDGSTEAVFAMGPTRAQAGKFRYINRMARGSWQAGTVDASIAPAPRLTPQSPLVDMYTLRRESPSNLAARSVELQARIKRNSALPARPGGIPALNRERNLRMHAQEVTSTEGVDVLTRLRNAAEDEALSDETN